MSAVENVPESAFAFRLSETLRSKMEPMAIGQTLHAHAGQVLFRQGDASVGVYLLLTGKARISMLDDKQRMITSREVAPGCIVGLPAALCGQPYFFTTETQSECTFGYIATECFQEFLRVHPELCMEVLQLMSKELAIVNQKRVELSKCMQAGCSMRQTCSSECH